MVRQTTVMVQVKDAVTTKPLANRWVQIYKVEAAETTFAQTNNLGWITSQLAEQHLGEWIIKTHDYEDGSIQVNAIVGLFYAYLKPIGVPMPPQVALVRIEVREHPSQIKLPGIFVRITGADYSLNGHSNSDGIIEFEDIPVGRAEVLLQQDAGILKPVTHQIEIRPPAIFYILHMEIDEDILIPPPPPDDDDIPIPGPLELVAIIPDYIPNGIYHEGNPISIIGTIQNRTLETKHVQLKMRSAAGKVLDVEPDYLIRKIAAGGQTEITVKMDSVIPASFKDEWISIELHEKQDGFVHVKHLQVGSPTTPSGEKYPGDEEDGLGGLIVASAIILGGAYLAAELLKSR